MTTKKRLSMNFQAGNDVVVKYNGHGDFVPGIPARDMTPDEWEALPEDLRAIAIKLDLYVAVATDQESEK